MMTMISPLMMIIMITGVMEIYIAVEIITILKIVVHAVILSYS